MNNKFLNSMCTFTAIVVSVFLTGGCVAQTGATQSPGARTQSPVQGSASGSVSRTARANIPAANPAPLDPVRATEKAPDKPFYVKFTTTRGDFIVEVNRAWAPNGADRFYNMCRMGYFKDIAIFRSMDNFMFQFGIHGDPQVSAKWMNATIQDDPAVGISNKFGTLSFAQTQNPNTRSVQIFVNTNPDGNAFLDKPQPRGGSPFVPFGRIVKGIDVVQGIHITGENAADVQAKFQRGGNDYIKAKYPKADYIRSAALGVANK